MLKKLKIKIIKKRKEEQNGKGKKNWNKKENSTELQNANIVTVL